MSSPSFQTWLVAARPRTLLLAIANISMGIFLAFAKQNGHFMVGVLCLVTAIFLQVLSNLANDYGDSLHGADSAVAGRLGPKRAVQSGLISSRQMRSAIGVLAGLAVLSGLMLIALAFGLERLPLSLVFTALGGAAIWAAIAYTATQNPYGYAGLGDLMVFIFFGLVAVLGSYYLQAKTLSWDLLLPATASGLFSVAVLNVNNIRDLESDKKAGKYSIPVRIGPRKARLYHAALLSLGSLAAVTYVAIHYTSLWQLLFLIALPLLALNAVKVWQGKTPAELDPLLKQMSITTFVFTVLFGVGLILGLILGR